MSLALLFPLGLLALAAWLVPLLVHLARRQQYATLEFAALRWLRAKARPRQRIRLDEWPLLLVRLLLLAALAVLLARPVLRGGAPDTRAVVVVAPGVDAARVRTEQPQADARWLAPGFASIDTPAPPAAQPLTSLLRELDQQLPAGAPLTVYVPDPLTGADAQRPRLSRSVHWRPLATPPLVPTARAGTALRLRPGTPLEADAERVLNALQRAWTGQPLAAAAASAPRDGEIGVWLSATPLSPPWQAWLERGGTLLGAPAAASGTADAVVLRDADGRAVLGEHRVGKGRVLRFSAVLAPSTLPILQDPSFPRQLQTLLHPTAAPQWVGAADHAPLAGAAVPAPRPRELAPWLLGLIVLLFALERWWATSPRRGVRA